MSIKPEELKPCPFCGSSKAFAMNAESSVFCFGCDACDARVYGISEKASKKRWNARAIPDTHRVVSVEDLKALEDKLDFWINSADTRSMSESEYKTWLALGHQSKTARQLRAIIEGKGQ